MATRYWPARAQAFYRSSPSPRTSGNPKRGLFTVADFIYDAENDRYTCPRRRAPDQGKGALRPPR